MEIDITDFALSADPFEYSASRAERGENAGKITWANAKGAASTYQFITPETRPEFEAWVKGFGAWDEAERRAWSLDECNALLIQFISGDLRELTALCPSDTDEYGIDWAEAEKLASEGTISGRIFGSSASVDGRIYFYMGE